MLKGKVSEKMQRAVRKLQGQIGNPHNQYYQNLSSDEASSPRSTGRSLNKRTSLGRDRDRDDLKSDNDDEEDNNGLPSDVPEGFLAVYVGSERQRFVISANYLKHQMFKVLLEKSAEEYGFEHEGGLPIVCDVASFEHLLWSIKSQNPGGPAFQLSETASISDMWEAIYVINGFELFDHYGKRGKEIDFTSACELRESPTSTVFVETVGLLQ